MIKLKLFMILLMGILVSNVSYGQNLPAELDLDYKDAVAFQKYVDGYDVSRLDGVDGNLTDIVVSQFVTEYLVMQRHFDRKCLRLGKNDEYYYAATMICRFMGEDHEGDDAGSMAQGAVSAGEQSDLQDLTNEELSRYQEMGLMVYSMRGGVPLPSADFSKGAGNNLPQMRSVNMNDSRTTNRSEVQRNCQIALYLKPIIPEIVITPMLDKDSNPAVGSEIGFKVHVGWRGMDIDKAKLHFESNGEITLDRKDAESGVDGNCDLGARINDYGNFEITAVYSVYDDYWGEMAVEYNYFFSLKKDDMWAYDIKVADRMSQPFYDYTLKGEMQFATFKYGKSNYRVYEEVLLELDVTKERQNNEEDEVSIPVAYIGTSAMSFEGGSEAHDMTATKVSYDGEGYEAILLFDIGKYGSYKDQAEGEVSQNLEQALMAVLFSEETKVESTVAPIWAMRLPLHEGSQSFNFAFNDLSSMTFGVPASDIEALEKGSADKEAAMRILAANTGCAIIPNPLRLVQMLQTGNLLMMFASGMEDGNGSISGTVQLTRVEEK